MSTHFYMDLAEWWPLMSAPEDYVEEATFYTRQLVEHGTAPARTCLELGSGGGNNASHMKRTFELTLVELSRGMLDESRKLNPECAHHLGDMRTVRLAKTFDRVFIHDAISYMTTESDLRAALQTAFVHCRAGGAALFAPDHLQETYRAATDCGGHDRAGRALRYLEWSYDPDPADTTCITEYGFLLRDRDGSVRMVHDRHVEGIFPRATWLGLIREAGFTEAKAVRFDHSELEPGSYEIFVAVR